MDTLKSCAVDLKGNLEPKKEIFLSIPDGATHGILYTSHGELYGKFDEKAEKFSLINRSEKEEYYRVSFLRTD